MVEGYPDSLGRWGAPAIFKEAGRLIGKYFGLLHPFIGAFFLPLAVIQLLQIYGLAWVLKHLPHPPHPHPGPFPPHFHHFHHHHHLHHHHHPFGGFRAFYVHSQKAMFGSEGDAFSPVPPPHPHPPLAPLLIAAAIAILAWVLLSLAIASIAKAIAYIYSSNDEDPTITKSIFKSLPTSLYHLFITTLWILLITFLSAFILSVPFHLILFFFKKINPEIIFVINIIVVDLALLLLGFVFLLAPAVTVLEPENYGLASIKKGWKLVKSKVPAALIFFLVNLIFTGLLTKLSNLAVFLPVAKLPFWTVYIFGVIVAVLYLLVWVYFLVAGIVLYFSCKLKSEDDDQYLPVNSSEDNPYTPLVVPSEN